MEIKEEQGTERGGDGRGEDRGDVGVIEGERRGGEDGKWDSICAAATAIRCRLMLTSRWVAVELFNDSIQQSTWGISTVYNLVIYSLLSSLDQVNQLSLVPILFNSVFLKSNRIKPLLVPSTRPNSQIPTNRSTVWVSSNKQEPPVLRPSLTYCFTWKPGRYGN